LDRWLAVSRLPLPVLDRDELRARAAPNDRREAMRASCTRDRRRRKAQKGISSGGLSSSRAAVQVRQSARWHGSPSRQSS
jgi:hypothetical protein